MDKFAKTGSRFPGRDLTTPEPEVSTKGLPGATFGMTPGLEILKWSKVVKRLDSDIDWVRRRVVDDSTWLSSNSATSKLFLL